MEKFVYHIKSQEGHSLSSISDGRPSLFLDIYKIVMASLNDDIKSRFWLRNNPKSKQGLKDQEIEP